MRTLLALLVLVGSANAYADDEAPTPAPPGETAETSHRAEKGTLGVGLIIGEPTGISAKLYLEDDKAIQAAVGSAFIGGGLQAHGDFVLHPLILQDRESFVLPVYVGPGLRFIQYNGGRAVIRTSPSDCVVSSACCSTSRKCRSTYSSKWPASSSTTSPKVGAQPSTPALACGTTSNVFEELTRRDRRWRHAADRQGRSRQATRPLAPRDDDRRPLFRRACEGGFAHSLADTGLEVYVADFRGHGRSMPPRAGAR